MPLPFVFRPVASILRPWFVLMGIGPWPTQQGKEYDGRTMWRAMLDSRVVRIGRCYDRTYATNIGARYAARCGVLQPCVRSFNIRMLEVMRLMCKNTKKTKKTKTKKTTKKNVEWFHRAQGIKTSSGSLGCTRQHCRISLPSPRCMSERAQRTCSSYGQGCITFLWSPRHSILVQGKHVSNRTQRRVTIYQCHVNQNCK